MFHTQGQIEEFLLEHLHGNGLRCHHCISGKKQCAPCPGDQVVEYPPRQPECPDPALHAQHGTHEPRRRWRCRCCRSYLSVTSGTLLDGVKLPLRMVMRCLYNLVEERYGKSTGPAARNLNRVNRNARRGSVHLLMHRIRGAMDEELPPFEGTTEIDEAVVNLPGGPIHLIGAYNHRTRLVRIEIISKHADQAIMRDFILRVTAPGSRIYTDGTAAYPENLPDRSHHIVIHSNYEWGKREEVKLPGGEKTTIYVTTNRIERSWGFLKRALRIPVTVSPKHFPRYLAETQWRINHLHNRKEAETYTGNERRNLVLMGQLVANMYHRRITVKGIRGGESARTEPQRRRRTHQSKVCWTIPFSQLRLNSFSPHDHCSQLPGSSNGGGSITCNYNHRPAEETALWDGSNGLAETVPDARPARHEPQLPPVHRPAITSTV